MKIRMYFHSNSIIVIAINVPHNTYLKVHINKRHITQTIAKIYDIRSKALSPKRNPSTTKMLDIMSHSACAAQMR